jgi:uncharacterized protein YndB with AHSA1/START domain
VTIDESAPAVARAEIEIAASLDVVWSVLADVVGWPRWSAAVKRVEVADELAPGSTFRWKVGPGMITSTVRELDPPSVFGWTGRTFGVRALHVHRLEERDGRTSVTSEESWDGWPVRLFRARMHAMLQRSLDDGLAALKAEAEQRA